MYFGKTKQNSFSRYSLLELRLTLGRKIKEMNDSHTLQALSMIPGENEKKEQDTAFLLDKSYADIKKYITSQSKRITIKWTPRGGLGLANNLRAIRGIILLAIANNASICFDYDNYYSVMNDSLKILKCQISQKYEFWPERVVMSWVRRQLCNYYLNNNTLIATCYDLSYFFTHCSNFITDISKHINHINSKDYLTFFSSFIFQPKKYIIDYAYSVLSSMNGIKVGIQLRFGGLVSVTRDSDKFLIPNRFYLVINQIKQIFNEIHKPFSVFLSTDSLIAADMLKPLNISMITASKYKIGHSGRSATMERAVTDIYILSRCDVLIYTFRSSYGRFARDLSKSNMIYVLKTYYVCITIAGDSNYQYLLLLMIVETLIIFELLLSLQNNILMKRNMINLYQITYSNSLRVSKHNRYDNNPIWTNIGTRTSESYIPQFRSSLNTTSISFNKIRRESMPLYEYFSNNKRSLLIKYRTKDNTELANHIGPMRGMILFSIINNASFCTDDDGYLKYMDDYLNILECQNVTIKDYWNESYAINWFKEHECNYRVTQNTEITAVYDLSVHFSHCDNFIDNLIFNANQLNTKEYRELVTKFLFQPKQGILKAADTVLSRLNYYFIGIDIHINKENQRIIPNNMINNETSQSIQQIKQILSKYDNTYSIYISYNIPMVKNSFKNLKRNVIFTEDIVLKSQFLNATTYEKDVLNIWILSHCHVLIHTPQSRNGEIAREISTMDEMNVLIV